MTVATKKLLLDVREAGESILNTGHTVLPARTTVQSVLWNQIKVEIDCVARKP